MTLKSVHKLSYVEDRIICRGMAASVDDFVGHIRYMRINTRVNTHLFECWGLAERGVTSHGHPVRPNFINIYVFMRLGHL